MSTNNKDNETSKLQVVTPWNVEGIIDYKKLISQFGTESIDSDLINRFEKVTKKKVHPWISRGIFFSHRELNSLLDAYEKNEPIFLYTGRGPTSESMHLGHLIPFIFTKWLQDVFDCPLVIQIADDEKYYFKELSFDTIYNLGFENAKDIIACGFNPDKTFIFSNRDYRMECKEYERFVSEIKRCYSAKKVAKIFGFGKQVIDTDGNNNYVYTKDVTVGMLDWPFYQSAASFSSAFPHIFTKKAFCLVAHAIDQDPYFRMARDIADKMKLNKPCSIMCTFVPPLTGNSGKMSSSSNTETTLFLTDQPNVISEKIRKYAYSGESGDGTLKYHREHGGDLETNISYQYLKYFELDDDKLLYIKTEFETGRMSCSEIKTIMSKKIVDLFKLHQHNRNKITTNELNNFYCKKQIDFYDNN